eukprot:TRINITY_DN10407_c0_g1_i1.p1 TRINITY_DN10407_c0_g1~~TRINITY_DN10407_c0_g1_i1.p1  ORF type:complete len:324 (+),score=48.49 TRINITY_DN10407_c0_g1_i1:48-1019(+)
MCIRDSIYTMGVRSYAEKVVAILDPERHLFKENILSRDDCNNSTSKTTKRIFPCDDSMVLIIDDRADVWGYEANLIGVKPYLFFRDMRVNALPGDAALDLHPMGEDVKVTRYIPSALADKHLQYILKLIQGIHTIFYQNIKNTKRLPVRSCFHRFRQTIFAGVHLAFSSVFDRRKNAEESELWKLCLEYGATLTLEISNATTHLVAAKDHTDKVRKASKAGIYVVNVAWLIDSMQNFARMDESEYTLQSTPPEQLSGGCTKEQNVFISQFYRCYANFEDTARDEDEASSQRSSDNEQQSNLSDSDDSLQQFGDEMSSFFDNGH